MIVVVDYGAGNVQSVVNALERVGIDAMLTADADIVAVAEGLIVPGVGAARDTMLNLREKSLVEPVLEFIDRGRPYLGICMGMQALMSRSEEHGGEACLDVIAGAARELDVDVQVPHMGWNAVDYVGDGVSHPLFDGIPSGSDFYFAHSFYCAPEDPRWVLGMTDYGRPFPTVLGRGAVMAVQFHPEKSGPNGLRMLFNFGRIVAATPGMVPADAEIAR